jgi:hypothetical protein
VIVSLDQDVEVFDTETLATDYKTGEAAVGEEYSCLGTIPGNTVSCNGKASGGNRVKGTFGVENACVVPRARFAVIVMDKFGSPSASFPLYTGQGNKKNSPVQGCPKPPKATKRAVKKSAKRAVRR